LLIFYVNIEYLLRKNNSNQLFNPRFALVGKYLLWLDHSFALPAPRQKPAPMLFSGEKTTCNPHTIAVTTVVDYHKSYMNYLSQINLPPSVDVTICMGTGTMEHVLYTNNRNTILLVITNIVQDKLFSICVQSSLNIQ